MEYSKEIIHGGDLITCREVFGDMRFIDFSASINPLGQPESVRRAIEGCADACMAYPDVFCRKLKSAIARYEDVPEEWLVCGNGASDVIYRVALGLKPRAALIPAPTFAEYERALAFAGCDMCFHMLDEATGFVIGEKILDEIPESGIIFICNPNNPTGRITEKGLLERLATACDKRGSALVVDECFLEFVDGGEGYSLKGELEGHRNVILMRAFTKMYALPGIRLGYAIVSDPATRELLERAAAPWSVSVPAQLCGVAAAGEKDYAEKTRRRMAEWREKLASGLEKLGFKVYPSHANYLMFRSKREDLVERLCERGIVIRGCANFPGLSSGFYRVAVRSEEENMRLLEAVEVVLRQA